MKSSPSTGASNGQVDPWPVLGLARALQKSEIRRAQLLLGVLACLLLIAVTRNVTGGIAMQGLAFAARLVVLSAGTVYVIGILLVVRRTEANDRLLPSAFWVVTALLEPAIPTLNILSLIAYAAIDDVDALAAPAMVVYFLFTIVSVLRLRPGLCLVSAGVAAVQHAAVVIYAIQRTSGSTASLYPYYLSYSLLILVGGFCAAIVSIEIRKHVLAGLREATARAELAEVRRNLEIARQIQQSLLPREAIPITGYELAAWNRPADETGGDYYDWIPLNDGRCAVIIADVTGHGIGSALLMAICRAYARASMPTLDPLRTAMNQLNRLLYDDVGLGRFVTFAVAILSPDHDEIELLSAGHGPTLVCRRADGAIESFAADGLPLGVIAQEDFDEPRRIRMSKGDSLLLITDGFMEAHNSDGDMFGIPRLSKSFVTHASGDIDQIVSRIDSDVRAFSQTHPQSDDMTAVIIRRTV